MTELDELRKVPVRQTALAIGYVALADVPLAWREKCSDACGATRGKLIVPTVGEAVFEGDWNRWLGSLGGETV